MKLKSKIDQDEIEMVSTTKIEEMADWILKNRKKSAFIGWTKRDLMVNIALHTDNNTCLFGRVGEDIYGIVLWNESPAYKMIHINQLLSVNPDFMLILISIFKKMYGKGWKIRGNRHGYIRDIGKNTLKYLDKLSNYEQRRIKS